MASSELLHLTRIDFYEPFAAELKVGMPVNLKVKVGCECGCDLRGCLVRLSGPRGVIVTAELLSSEGGFSETEELIITAPEQVGKYEWEVFFPECETPSGLHRESRAVLSFQTVPHEISTTIWDIPTAPSSGERVSVKVGVCCASSCRLSGGHVEIYDEGNHKISEGQLEESPWSGSKALFWAELSLVVPEAQGVYSKKVRIVVSETKFQHEEKQTDLSYRVGPAFKHVATVRVLHVGSEGPIPNVEVRCGFYKGITNESGVAKISLPGGTFEITTRKDGFKSNPFTIVVSGDLDVNIPVTRVQKSEERALGVFENYPWG